MNETRRHWRLALVIAGVLLWAVLGAMACRQDITYPEAYPGPDSVVGAAGYVGKVHGDGPSKLVVESGGEVEVQSGGILDLQEGSLVYMLGDQSSAGTLRVNALVVTTTVDVDDNADFAKGVAVGENLTVTQNVDVDGITNVDVFDADDNADFAKNVAVAENLTVTQNVDVDGITNVDVLDADDDADFAKGLAVGENLTVTQNVDVDGITNVDVLDADGAADFAEDVTANKGLSVGENITITQNATVSGVGIFATLLRGTPQTAITVTTNGYITPTGLIQPLAAAGNVETANLAIGTAGDLLVLTNNSDTTITITDTGTIMLEGNAEISQYDTLTLYCDGTNWRQVSKQTN